MSSSRWRLPRRHPSSARRPGAGVARPVAVALGQSVVEFALIVPIMLLLLAGAIDLGRVFYTYVAVENAAKEGALYGARHPLCPAESASCPAPRNVKWIVENEAANLKDGSGRSLMTTTVSCRTPQGAQVPSMDDCTNGSVYVVRVTSNFRLITPILGDLLASSLKLDSTSEATVVEGAYDPSGLEVLVWADRTGAENATTISKKCVRAEPSGSPDLYYAPCQDQSNGYNYLEYQEGTKVKFKVRLRNTGNIDLALSPLEFLINGSPVGRPSDCSRLKGVLARNSPPVFCFITQKMAAATLVNGTADYVVTVDAQGQPLGLAPGRASGSATVKVVPAPRLVVNVRAARYRMGGDGNGAGGTAQYGSGNLTLNRTTDSAANAELRKPVGWLKVNVTNKGGVARDFQLSVTQDGAVIPLPASCPVPSSLAASGSAGDDFTCIIARPLDGTTTYRFAAVATATNALNGGGDPTVEIRTRACDASQQVVPNLVDTLLPGPDGSRKTIGQARALWQAAGFSGPFSTVPSAAQNSAPVLTQDVDAYTCENPGQGVQVDAR